MKQHEREFFIALIRSGNVYITYNDLELVIKPPTLEQNIRACQVYQKTYEEAYHEGIMTEEETEEWMMEQELWTPDDMLKVKGLEKDLETLKVEIYNARNDNKLKKSIRHHLRSCEQTLLSYLNKKSMYFSNTCEGLASIEKTYYTIKKTTYLKNKLYHFDDMSLASIVSDWNNSILSETKIRELARTEPWKTLWVIKKNKNVSLFANAKNTELTHNQKSILIWSQMYDNIQESLDCPSNDVIEDDDMLDGWFIIQNRKRQKERAEKEFEETTNQKIKNSSEVFIMSKDKKDKDRVESMNDINAKNIIKQRQNLINRRGSVEQQQFFDEQLKMQTKQNESFKSHVRGGR